jgi:hypothetical protein
VRPPGKPSGTIYNSGYNSGGFRLTVHPGTLDVTVDVQLRPGEPRP